MIEWTVSLGAVLTGISNAVMILVAAIGFYYSNKFQQQMIAREISILGGRMINVENEIKELVKIVAVQAVQDEKMENLSLRITTSERESQEWRQSIDRRLDIRIASLQQDIQRLNRRD